MEITKQNVDQVIEDFGIKKGELLKSLLKDIDEFNDMAATQLKLVLCIIDVHEENDEVPDYYGEFKLFVRKHDETEMEEYLEPITLESTIEEIDTALCSLISYFEELQDVE